MLSGWSLEQIVQNQDDFAQLSPVGHAKISEQGYPLPS